MVTCFLASADPILLGAIGKTQLGGGWNAFVRVSLRLFHDSVHFQLKKQKVFFFFGKSKRLYDIHVTWFGRFLRRENVTAHSITINYHSCFRNRWPDSKTKLKLKHLWEQGAPGISGALRSLHILQIGWISSALSKNCTHCCNWLFFLTWNVYKTMASNMMMHNTFFKGHKLMWCYVSCINRCVRLEAALSRMISVWHHSTARAIREQTDPMLLNPSR